MLNTRLYPKQYVIYKFMRLFTVLVGIVLLLTTMVLVSHSFKDSVAFSALVNMNWTSSTAFHKNPIALYGNSMPQSKVYAIIIDAGSTGTRIHVYKFRYSNDRRVPYVLVDELFEHIKPGLSSYAGRVHELRPGLERLLQSAKKKVPRALWSHTAVSLKATAGLRLLPGSQADALLQEATAVLHESGFMVGPDGVSILSGLDEGVFGWVAVNFLLRRVRSPGRSVGTLDLGGGSVQVTFVPSAAYQAHLRDSLHEVQLPGVHGNEKPDQISVYSHSYLGLGLMSARHSLLMACRSVTMDTKLPSNNTEIDSQCLPAGYHGHWKFSGVRYSLSNSHGNSESRLFDICYRYSRQLVTMVTPVHGTGSGTFFLFSYFYDRVADAHAVLNHNYHGNNSVGSDSLGTVISPGEYRALATRVCSLPRDMLVRKPFLCLDLTYIYALLRDGFQFPDKLSLQLTKTVNNIELGWALGAVFDLLYRTEHV